MLTRVPRADRVALRIPIAYRAAGDDEWFQSRIVNISETGVLFGPTGLQAGAQVEVMFSPPMPIGSIPPGTLICSGRIVRIDEALAAGASFRTRRFAFDS